MSGLIRMVYVSRATFEPMQQPGAVEPEIARVLMQSRRNNPKHEIGGVLYYGDGCFFQCLEGQSDHVNQLIGKIMVDPRHRDLQILDVAQIDHRDFATWSMKYIPADEAVWELLNRHGFEAFDPYRFSDRLVQELVALFASLATTESKPDQQYLAPPPPPRPPRWRRMLAIFGVGD